MSRVPSAMVILAAALLAIAPASAAPVDGTLVSDQPCAANPVRSYDAYVAAERAFLDEERELGEAEGRRMPPVSDAQLRAALDSPAAVADHLAYAGFACRAIVYYSGGLRIAGFLWRPLAPAGRRLPLVIVNRGGNADFGAMEPWRDWGFHDFLTAGYVVLASQYRGGPGSEGSDEFGGHDVDDVAALLPLARRLGYIDTYRIFVFGGSRGGMESYLLARRGVPIRAMAIRAGVSDLFSAAAARPAFEWLALAPRIPGYAASRDALLAERSAVRWAGEIAPPVILFQGGGDWRVDPRDTLAMATALQTAGRTVELHLYEGDDHALTLNRHDMTARTLAFFAAHGGMPMPALAGAR